MYKQEKKMAILPSSRTGTTRTTTTTVAAATTTTTRPDSVVRPSSKTRASNNRKQQEQQSDESNGSPLPPEEEEVMDVDGTCDDGGVPIDDSMLVFDSDDEDDDEDDDNQKTEKEAFRRSNGTVQSRSNQQEKTGNSGEITNKDRIMGGGDEKRSIEDSSPPLRQRTTADATSDDADAQLQQQMQTMFALESSSSDDEDDDDHHDDDKNKNNNASNKHSAKGGLVENESPLGVFTLESSSDDDDGEDGDDDIIKDDEDYMEKQDGPIVPNESEPVTYSDDEKTIVLPSYSEALSLIREAFHALEMLGVTLVEQKTPQVSSTARDKEQKEEEGGSCLATFKGDIIEENDRESEKEEEEIEEEGDSTDESICWIPRSDESVAADLLCSIHSLSRIQLMDKDFLEYYQPFVTNELVPACNYNNHNHGDNDNHVTTTASSVPENPMVKGKYLAFRALVILDTYCGEEGDGLLDIIVPSTKEKVDMEMRKIAIGLEGRRLWVQSLISSLDGEITQCWPEQDRADNFNTSALHNNNDNNDESTAMDSVQNDDEDNTEEELDMTVVQTHVPEETLDSIQTTRGPVLDTKGQGRLSRLVERAVLVQLVIGYYYSHDESDKVADLIWQYILSTAPGQDEDHTKLAPTLSFVLLESMLVLQPNMVWWLPPQQEEPHQHVVWHMLFCGEEKTSPFAVLAEKAVKLCLEVTNSIWKHREMTAKNARIRDLARVEVAAHDRLVKAGMLNSSSVKVPLDDWKSHAAHISGDICREAVDMNRTQYGQGQKGLRLVLLSYQLCLILGHQAPPASLLIDVPSTSEDAMLLISRGLALREIEIRQLEIRRTLIGTDSAISTPFEFWLDEIPSMTSNTTGILQLDIYSSQLQVAAILANGRTVLRAAQFMMELVCSSTDIPDRRKSSSLSLLGEISQIPLVRVINLRCRPDRMRAFRTQAMVHGLTVVLAAASLSDDKVSSSKGDWTFFGQYAFDGRGKWSEASERLAKQVGDQLDSFVGTHWRPHDLKAFDTNAPDGEGLVRASPSERACALSHVASWKGALRSFHIIQQETTRDSTSILRRPQVLERLFHLSGFAEGTAMHVSNRNMNPAPVCLILEDDAILVDRFTDRLKELLRELPRDFHFCSLGYSRPKTAPIVSYREHVGIPTNLFYLTGYLISEAGAEFPLDSLPVVGPIDSWIGLKMTNNFDNIFGSIVGVGRSKPLADPLPNKDLCTILKFRAFCALQPLCTQRVGVNYSASLSTAGSSPMTSSGGRSSWRLRDTDIEYSGGKWNYMSSKFSV